MTTYYVTHPNLSRNALITAPTTEKARTTFLDYLERQNLIGRADRQQWRRNMVAERMDDPRSVQADVELFYGYEEAGPGDAPPLQMSVRETAGGYTDEERERYYSRDEIPPTDEVVELLIEKDDPVDRSIDEERSPESNVQDVAREAPRKLSPIQQLSLGRLSRDKG